MHLRTGPRCLVFVVLGVSPVVVDRNVMRHIGGSRKEYRVIGCGAHEENCELEHSVEYSGITRSLRISRWFESLESLRIRIGILGNKGQRVVCQRRGQTGARLRGQCPSLTSDNWVSLQQLT